MGELSALAMSEVGDDLGIDLRQQLSWHLGSNHYPPVPQSMIEACINAIDAGNEGDFDRLIDLPDGALWRGQTSAPAHAIIDGHHLNAWIDYEDYA
jgi:hypothetical protein